MSAQLLSSKTVVEEKEPSVRPIQGVLTGVGACCGLAKKGPIGVATRCTSWTQWKKIFGADHTGGYTPNAVRGFFDGGGQALYFTRAVHYTDVTSAATKTSAAATRNLQTAAAAASAGSVTGSITGPFALANGDTLIVDRDALGTATATIAATAATRTAGAAETYGLTDGQTLTVEIDGGPTQTITFLTSEFSDIANATAAEVAAVINAGLVGGYADDNSGSVRITSDSKGTGSSVNVTGGTANAVLTFTTGATTGTGNVADVDLVTAAEIKTIVEAAVTGVTVTDVSGAVKIASNTTGAASMVQVTATSTADDELGFDNAQHLGSDGTAVDTLQVDAKYDGTYGNALQAKVSAATSGIAAEFNLDVLESGVIVETFPNVTMDDAADNYVETVVNDVDSGSFYIAVTDLDVDPTSAANERPADGTSALLTGGDDGLSSIADADFIGDSGEKNGLYSFDQMDDANLLFVPDRATAAVQVAMLSYCEVTKGGKMFAILDSPEGLDSSAVVTYVSSTAGLTQLSEHGAFYWPRVKVVNPNTSVFGSAATITVPPSGHIAGMFARTDGARTGGVYDPPAGVVKGKLFNVVGLETDEVLEEAVRDYVSPYLINPIAKLEGWPIAVNDSQNLQTSGNFASVTERRGASYIERSVKNGLEPVRQRINNEELRQEAERTVDAFLEAQMSLGAFASTTDKDQAYFVDTDEATVNPPAVQAQKILNVDMGLAMGQVARFVRIRVSSDVRGVAEAIATAS